MDVTLCLPPAVDMTIENDINQRFPYTLHQCPLLQNCNLLLSTDQHFSGYRSSLRQVHNDPQMTLNPVTSKIPLICVTLVPECQNSIYFALRSTLFKLQPLWDMYIEWPKNDIEHKIKGTTFCVTSVYEPKFHPVSLKDQPCSRFRLCEK